MASPYLKTEGWHIALLSPSQDRALCLHGEPVLTTAAESHGSPLLHLDFAWELRADLVSWASAGAL